MRLKRLFPWRWVAPVLAVAATGGAIANERTLPRHSSGFIKASSIIVTELFAANGGSAERVEATVVTDAKMVVVTADLSPESPTGSPFADLSIDESLVAALPVVPPVAASPPLPEPAFPPDEARPSDEALVASMGKR